jgi:hypothetical protein
MNGLEELALRCESASGADRECGACGRVFRASAYQARKSTAVYCSTRCGAEAGRRSRWAKNSSSVEERFDRFVIRRGAGECWAWAGFRHKGYGRLSVGKLAVGAHRVSYELHHGPIPTGLTVLHSCDNPECTNPAHLSLGTNADNNLDRDRKGRTARGLGNGRSRFTPALVRSMRAARKSGATWKQIASRFNVSEPGARSACTGRTWGHLA